MKARWADWQAKTNALSLRERGILLATLIVLIGFIWLQWIFLPWEKQQTDTQAQISSVQQEQTDSSTNIQVLSIQLGKNPNDELREAGRELSKQFDELGRHIETRLAQLLAPQQMVSVMQNVLSDYQGMTLLSAKNLPAVPLDLSGNDVSLDRSAEASVIESKQEAGEAVVYSHVFELTLEGSYFQTLSFLQRLEAMEGFFWQGIEYQVTGYPKAEVTIKITTLSLQEEWIGV